MVIKMGIRENFTQAVKELTGGNKDDAAKQAAEKKGVQVEDLKRAVNEEAPDIREDFAPFETAEEAGAQDEKAESHISEDLKLGKNELAEKKIEPVSGTETIPLEQGSIYPQAPQTAQPVFTPPPSQAPTPPPVFNPPPQSPPMQNVQGRNFQNIPPANSAPAYNFTNGGYAANSGYSGYQDNRNIWDKPYYSSYQPSGNNYSDAEITVISKNTVIDGNIRSFANMSIDGDIKGDVETTKNIDINGKVVGNITCNNAEMHTSQIQGNIRMKGNVVMERDTLLIGDLVSTYAKVNGKVKGNLEIVGKAELKGDAVVFGDISASTITVDDGAIIQGYVSTTFLNKEESRNIFPDTISIGEAVNNS